MKVNTADSMWPEEPSKTTSDAVSAPMTVMVDAKRLAVMEAAEKVCRAYKDWVEAETNANWQEGQKLSEVYSEWRKVAGQ